MNKLELLYKMAGQMKTKETIKGNVNIIATEGNKEFANLQNNFIKDTVNKTVSIDANALFDNGELKINKSFKKDIDFEEMHKKHHEHKHGENACNKRKGCNKFEKLEILFKVLKDIEVKEIDTLNVLELDIKDILEKKKAKIANCKDKCNMNEKLKEIENCEFADMLKIKHAVLKELMTVDFESATLSLVLNADCSIKQVRIEAIGEKSFSALVNLNY